MEIRLPGNIYSSPVIGPDGTIYIGSSGSGLLAISPDGSFLWNHSLGGSALSTPAVGSDGTIYVGSDNHFLTAVNPDGTRQWRHEGSCFNYSSPAIGPDGTIFGGGQPSFYALYSSSDGLADTSWPMFQQNARHTGKWENVVTPLLIDDPAESTVPPGGIHYYSVEPDADHGLLIELQPGAGANSLLLNGQLGASTLSSATLTPNGTYELLISPTAAAVYTLSIYGVDVGVNGGAYTLTARYVDRHLSDLSPRTAGNAGEVRLEITGLRFSDPAQVSLSGPVTINASEVSVGSDSEVLAHFDLTGSPVGTYDVTVTWPDMTDVTLPDAFEIVAGTGPNLEAHLVAPEGLRALRRYVVWLEYANTGDADMPAPLFTVRANVDVSLDHENIDGHSVEVLGIGGSANPDVLRAGESMRVPIYFIAPNLGSDAEFELLETPDTDEPIDWPSLKDGMRPPDMDPGVWDALWPDLIARLGTTWSEYLQVLRDNAARAGSWGFPTHDPSGLIDLEVLQAAGEPDAAIAGELRLATTNELLPGVTLRLRSLDGTVVKETDTTYTPPGRFVFNEVPDGSYEIWIEGYYIDPVMQVDVIGADVTGVQLVGHPYEPVELSEFALPQHTPAMTADPSGTQYLLWKEGTEIWWAINTGGVWTHSGPIPDADGSNPAIVYDDALLDGGMTPGLFAAWETSGLESTIEWSVGRLLSESIEWSEPEALTSDLADDFSVDVFTDTASMPVVLWLQRDYSIDDDTDLYYQSVGLSGVTTDRSTLDPNWASLLPGDWDFCNSTPLGIIKEFPPKIPILGGPWGWRVIGTGCEALESCDPLLTPKWDVKIPLGSVASFIGKLDFAFKFNTEPCECKYLLGDSRMSAQNVGLDFSPPVFNLPLVAADIPLGLATLSMGIQATMSGDLIWHSNFPSPVASEGTLDVGFGAVIEGKVQFIFGLEGTVTGTATSYWTSRRPDYGIKFSGECVRFLGKPEMLFGAVYEEYCLQYGSWCPPHPSCEPVPQPIDGETIFFGDRMVLSGSNGTLLDDPYPVTWRIEFVKNAFVGTGTTYEGNPVLGDISADLFIDGPPSVAKSSAGDVLVAWAKAEQPQDLGTRVWTSSYSGASWATAEPITPVPGFIKDPSVEFDSNGNAMAVWSEASNAGLDFNTSPVEDIVAATELADIWFALHNGSTWSSPTRLADIAGRDEQPSLARGPSSQIAATWLNQADDGGWSLYGAIWSGSAWSTPEVIATPPIAYRPLVYYQGGFPAVLWSQADPDDPESFNDWKLFWSSWNGMSWSTSEPVGLAAPLVGFDNPTEAISVRGLVFPDPPSFCCLGSCDDPPPPDPSTGGATQIPRHATFSPVVAAVDPNEKIGPAGIGAEHFIDAGDRLDYVVYFENLPAAAVPAQEVFVTDCLDHDVDLTSVTLEDVAFGDVIVGNDSGEPLFDTRVTIPDYRPGETKDWWVDIITEFDLGTGCLDVTFRTLDPVTGELPEDAFAGFLPPEDGTGRGQGHISLSANSKANLVDGTVITNRGTIVFDINESIVTNEVFNTIGSPLEPTLTVTLAGTGGGTVTSDPAGIDCGTDCTEAYPLATVVDLFEDPDPDSLFVGWSGEPDCSDGAVTMDGDRNCTATFDLIPGLPFEDGFESGDTSGWSNTVQ